MIPFYVFLGGPYSGNRRNVGPVGGYEVPAIRYEKYFLKLKIFRIDLTLIISALIAPLLYFCFFISTKIYTRKDLLRFVNFLTFF